MFILNAGLSYKSKNWLMNSTTEICEDKERVKLRKEMLVQSKLEHYSVQGRFQVQIIATTEKSESILQPEHCSVFGPYLKF